MIPEGLSIEKKKEWHSQGEKGFWGKPSENLHGLKILIVNFETNIIPIFLTDSEERRSYDEINSRC
jgi:hypothetical protein